MRKTMSLSQASSEVKTNKSASEPLFVGRYKLPAWIITDVNGFAACAIRSKTLHQCSSLTKVARAVATRVPTVGSSIWHYMQLFTVFPRDDLRWVCQDCIEYSSQSIRF